MRASVKYLLLISIPEIIFSGLNLLAIILKIMHLAPANIVLTFSMLTLAGIYMTLGIFLFSNTQINHMKSNNMSKYMILKMIFGFLAGFSLSVLLVAQWQRILHLPAADLLWSTGLAFLTLIFLMVIVVGFKYKRFLLVGVRLLISVGLLLLPYFLLSLLYTASR